MTNRLVKRGETTYIPEVPSRPEIPAYCVGTTPSPAVEKKTAGLRTEGQTSSGGAVFSSRGQTTAANMSAYANGVSSPYGGIRIQYAGTVDVTTGQRDFEIAPGVKVPQDAITEQSSGIAPANASVVTHYEGGIVCYSAIPAVQGVPAKTQLDSKLGWNAAARSIRSISGDGFVQFRSCLKPIGMVAGFANDDIGTSFNESTHAFYMHGTSIQVVEQGIVIATTPYSPADDPLLTIVRRSGEVTYYADTWHLRSTQQSTGPILLKAYLYCAGDFVDSPRIGPIAEVPPLTSYGVLTGSLPRLAGLFADHDYASLDGVLPRMTGAFTAQALNVLSGRMPRMAGLFADHDYASLDGILPVLSGSFVGGEPAFTVTELSGLAPLMVGSFLGRSGTSGALSGSLPRLAGLFADDDYAELRGAMPGGWLSYFDDGPAPGSYGEMEFLYLADYVVFQPIIFLVVHDGLQFADSASIVLLYDRAVYDGLALSETASPSAIIEAMVRDGLSLGDSIDVSRQALQYAVNIATGAVTTYSNFDFHGFVNAGGETYGYRPDGLYRLGGTTDDGELLEALLDLGSLDPGTNLKQGLSGAFLGLSTDGEAFMRLVGDDGQEWLYQIENRPQSARAKFGKGLASREWRVSLHFVEVSDVDLQSIEFLVYTAARRWKRG